MVKTTKKQFKLFCDEFKRQVIRMGLLEWRLDFIHGQFSTADCIAELDVSYLNRTVGVYFNHEIDTDILTETDILHAAKHEALELLVDDAFAIAQSRYITTDEIMSTRHTLVRRLEKLL